MNEMTLEYPETWLVAMGLNEADFLEETRMAAAMKLFERGRFSSGQAAQFAGVSRIEFLLTCRRWGVDTVSWDESDLEAEFSTQLPPKG